MTQKAPKYSPCVNPFLIQRTSVDHETGEIKFAEFEKRCGTRKATLCEPCAEIWKDDAYFALLDGAKKHGGSLTFLTLTAPGWKIFGQSHTAQFQNKSSERCACRKYHKPDDELVGFSAVK